MWQLSKAHIESHKFIGWWCCHCPLRQSITDAIKVSAHAIIPQIYVLQEDGLSACALNYWIHHVSATLGAWKHCSRSQCHDYNRVCPHGIIFPFWVEHNVVITTRCTLLVHVWPLILSHVRRVLNFGRLYLCIFYSFLTCASCNNALGGDVL